MEREDVDVLHYEATERYGEVAIRRALAGMHIAESRYTENEGAMREEKISSMLATTTDPKAAECKDVQATTVHEATWEEFQEANRKVGILHDGLFRRLAEYDRTR